nr:NAD(P)-dependent oxidoreductase [Aquabacterium terrae]
MGLPELLHAGALGARVGRGLKHRRPYPSADHAHCLKQCRCVGRLGVGLDNIDVEACRARGIAILPATGANAQSVAEYVITTALLLRRPGSYTVSDDVAQGHWPRPHASQCHEIAGATLGVVGFGGIGQLTARLAQGMGMRVIAASRNATATPATQLESVAMMSLEEVLAQATS